ncbi:MAG: LysR family transcriptional regulator [Acidimicrobiia bacterium]
MNDRSEIPNLTVQQLTYLVAVHDAPTWSRAAATLGVTQSALSQGLSELERRLGTPLFEWQGRRRVLRRQAAEVLLYAERVVAQSRDLARWLAEARDGSVGRIRVGMIDAAAVHHFPTALREFRREHPAVDFRLDVAASGQLLERLSRGALDLVVCVEPARPNGSITTQPLLVEPLGLYAPDGKRAGPANRWGPWVTFPAGSHTRSIIDDALRQAGAPTEVVAESHQPEVLREMVQLGLGWTVLPVVQAETEPAKLRRARAEPIAERTLVSARRTESPNDSATNALLELLLAAVS